VAGSKVAAGAAPSAATNVRREILIKFLPQHTFFRSGAGSLKRRRPRPAYSAAA
jgi:hypothetical protein